MPVAHGRRDGMATFPGSQAKLNIVSLRLTILVTVRPGITQVRDVMPGFRLSVAQRRRVLGALLWRGTTALDVSRGRPVVDEPVKDPAALMSKRQGNRDGHKERDDGDFDNSHAGLSRSAPRANCGQQRL